MSSPSLALPRPSPLDRLRFLSEPKWLITMLITVVVLVATYLGAIASPVVFAVALGTAMLTESLFSLLVRGHLINVQSAYVSGISVTILTNPQQGLIWPFALAAAISIASKYALVYKGRHLWNPTNFGISLLLLIAPAKFAVLSTQWNNNLVPVLVIWTLGLLIASRAKILHVTATYIAAFFAFGYLRSLISGDPYWTEIAPLTGPMYQLFIFFMITDPRTTVSTHKGRVLVALIIAAVECALRMANELPWMPDGIRAAPAFFALATVGPIALWLELRSGSTPKP